MALPQNIILLMVLCFIYGQFVKCYKDLVDEKLNVTKQIEHTQTLRKLSYYHILQKRAAQKPDHFANVRKRLLADKMLGKKNDTDNAISRPYPPVGILKTRPDNKNLRKLIELTNPLRTQNVHLGTECNFEIDCRWSWTSDIANVFVVASSGNLLNNETGPLMDADNNVDGHYLLLRLPSDTRVHVTSPQFNPSEEGCHVQLQIYQEAMRNGIVRIVLHHVNKTQIIANEIAGEDSGRWKKIERTIGKVNQPFSIILEVHSPQSTLRRSLVAFDNIKLLKCVRNESTIPCSWQEYRCNDTNICINNTRVCDITPDCKHGDDEKQNCDKVPFGARCTFEEDSCGWISEDSNGTFQWRRHHGERGTNLTGPIDDHTYGNSTGKYLHVMSTDDRTFARIATLRSVIFNPPPKVHGNSSSRYYNSCTIRFSVHQSGPHKSGLALQLIELRPTENKTRDIFWSFNSFKEPWVQQVVTLPTVNYRYYFQFDVRTGLRYLRDIALDDLSLSPECFGLNIPAIELNGYNYYNPDIDYLIDKEPHPDFVNKTYYTITTCGQTGRYGPSNEQCNEAYQDTDVAVKMYDDDSLLRGVQKWTVPSAGYYTFLLYGAGGGKGGGGMGSSRGAMVRVILELGKGQELYMAVGQEGTSACVKSLNYHGDTPSSCQSVVIHNRIENSTIKDLLHMEVLDGGGGGGGATSLFVISNDKQWVPIAVAAGGGGLGLRFFDTGTQHGQGINITRKQYSGEMNGVKSPGAGGGWRIYHGQLETDIMGQAITKGGLGGKACYNSTDGKGAGGFGGGGGGCTAGGGGGGYSGGNSWSENSRERSGGGEGGYSFYDTSRPLTNFSDVIPGHHIGQGEILILPAISGCGCYYRCLPLDAQQSEVACICPPPWKLGPDGKECLSVQQDDVFPSWTVPALTGGVLILTAMMGILCFLLYNRYQHRATSVFRRKGLSGADLQLNRLRVASESMMTEYNPNYEFGGIVYTLKDLKDIPRNQLRLVKALGQGAFGEVYQGFYRQRSGDAVEMPVAVKTLPEMSTNQAEMDFLMEALIMSKFNHPNIVYFIGVCFDKHPRFIVLELLAGGDLKNFLRESRPKPDRSSPLTMKDLILIAIDIAKGCRYLEENRFIHRDIAARNCLLTTKGPGRVVKIADFGMSRDIYRSDYYRKGGKAMLPIKWMPPEAFLDGIFTTKTDVWSFGVLLWEIMSLGYMPYTGCTNRDVMQLVTSGGRLESPINCPDPVYAIMTQCWHPITDQRPTFALILERLDYCAQDPAVVGKALPIFSRPPSNERDATVMRPNNSDGDNCLQVPQGTIDYLIPNDTLRSDTASGSTSSMDKLLPGVPERWETSFNMSHSKSTQPLIQDLVTNQAEIDDENCDQLVVTDTNQNGVVKQLSNSINPNNNGSKTDSTNNSLISGLSLDAGALIKQTAPIGQNKKYTNITGTGNNGVIANGSYSNSNAYLYNANKFANESEISC
ncbi:tyrosine-protein kinase receptor [Onthophagus taurus]|uniref:tyrosine-protein kinase receptor n=1 Tax=Onthophagus taurus TaxID=166361 RepID=UPI000C20DE80|nr:ALK tyrosine kinase receptor [Onthophagus taurus]